MSRNRHKSAKKRREYKQFKKFEKYWLSHFKQTGTRFFVDPDIRVENCIAVVRREGNDEYMEYRLVGNSDYVSFIENEQEQTQEREEEDEIQEI